MRGEGISGSLYALNKFNACNIQESSVGNTIDGRGGAACGVSAVRWMESVSKHITFSNMYLFIFHFPENLVPEFDLCIFLVLSQIPKRHLKHHVFY